MTSAPSWYSSHGQYRYARATKHKKPEIRYFNTAQELGGPEMTQTVKCVESGFGCRLKRDASTFRRFGKQHSFHIQGEVNRTLKTVIVIFSERSGNLQLFIWHNCESHSMH